MAKFNRAATKPTGTSPVVIDQVPSGVTYEGAPGYGRDVKSELFLLAVTNMVGEATFYEAAADRDNRYVGLVRQVAVEDVDWLGRFLPWLRGEAHMRSASLVAALEASKARLDAGLPGSRQLVDSVLRRADEPGEALAYWTSRYGRAIPMPVKRGIGDAVLRLGTEFNYVKWGTSEARGFSFADILNLTHPGDRRASRQSIRGPWQHDLFGYVVARTYRDVEIPESLELLTRRQALLGLPVDERRRVLEDPELLARAGMTWEALAGWLQGPMDAAAWHAVIPSMGYMALLRNLANFDRAGVPDHVAAQVAERLADPDQVARSRQLPFRFLSAHRAVRTQRWGHALDQALTRSLANIPALDGRTLVLVDTSASMQAGFSKDGTLQRWDAAALFGIALGARCEAADVVSFSGLTWCRGEDTGEDTKVFPLRAGESLLRALDRWSRDGYFLGNGTATAAATRAHYGGHDRVVIVTDEQARDGDPGAEIPAQVPLYTFNLAGYRMGATPGAPNRHVFGGLSDAGFRIVSLIEAGRRADWPF